MYASDGSISRVEPTPDVKHISSRVPSPEVDGQEQYAEPLGRMQPKQSHVASEKGRKSVEDSIPKGAGMTDLKSFNTSDEGPFSSGRGMNSAER